MNLKTFSINLLTALHFNSLTVVCKLLSEFVMLSILWAACHIFCDRFVRATYDKSMKHKQTQLNFTAVSNYAVTLTIYEYE